MSISSSSAKLVFAPCVSERTILEARDRGYLSHVLAEVDGHCYPVFFYDPVRLGQDLQESAKSGWPIIADPGMIVLPDLTLEAMENAVQRLSQQGFFEHLVPLTPDQLAKTDSFGWPPS
jgi:hypothetical protein